MKVKGVSDATAIVAGADHACALRSGGTAVCWGYNGALQLGHVPLPSVDFSLVPVMVSNLSGVTSLAASPFPSCATTATVVKCWGEGGNYQLGDTQTNDQPAPATAVVGLDKPTMVAVGATSTCEVASGNRVYCWGLNLAGEVGNGTNSAAPNGAGPWEKFGFALSPRVVPILNSAPGKPSGSSPSAGRIKISWAAPSTSNGTSAPKDYVIQYRLKGTSTWKTFKDSVSTSRTVTVTGLSRGKYYQFRVQPKNWAGAGTASAASGYIKSK